ncbi:hypothetical protein [Tropicimonas sp.]|uniref:hypothetical protein n=1 Tax=Tropicimonas sp. TaxID=2067044 RepID=UPI003A842521
MGKGRQSGTAGDGREKRLRDALKSNLAKRKAQARARAVPAVGESGTHADDGQNDDERADGHGQDRCTGR